MRVPDSVTRTDGCERRLYRFPNGYGASVIKGPYSYGGPEGLWELAVLIYSGEEYRITYKTPITNDVIGYVPESEIDEILYRIELLF